MKNNIFRKKPTATERFQPSYLFKYSGEREQNPDSGVRRTSNSDKMKPIRDELTAAIDDFIINGGAITKGPTKKTPAMGDTKKRKYRV